LVAIVLGYMSSHAIGNMHVTHRVKLSISKGNYNIYGLSKRLNLQVFKRKIVVFPNTNNIFEVVGFFHQV
jgi:hypothetical protein